MVERGAAGPPGAPGGGAADPLTLLPLQDGRTVPVVAFVGDSWSTESTMGTFANLPASTSQVLGVVPVPSAVNGSGFGYSVSGSDNFEAESRVNAVCAAAPNVVVAVGSLNSDKVVDNGDTGGASITAAVQAFVQRVRSRLPQVPIIVVGPQPSSVASLLSRSGHVNDRAVKAGVEAAGGAAAGVAFVDWLGIADRQAVPWTPGRVCQAGDVVVHQGVAWRVTEDWTPATGQTPASAGVPTVQVSAVLSGTGSSGSIQGDGTRDMLLLRDDTHPTTLGGLAFGADLAQRVRDAVSTLSGWAQAAGPVVPVRDGGEPPAPPVGDGLPVMAYLSGGWGDTERAYYTPADIQAVADLAPDRVVLPLRTVLDSANAAVAIPVSTTGADGSTLSFSGASLNGLRNRGINVADAVASLDLLEAAGIQVTVNLRNGLTDAAASYWANNDGKLFNNVLANRAAMPYSCLHGRGQSRLREIMVEQHPAYVRVCEAVDAASDWHVTDTVRAANQILVSASVAGPTVWGTLPSRAPQGVWVLVASRDEQAAARLAAEGAGVDIVGWAVGSPEALAAIRE